MRRETYGHDLHVSPCPDLGGQVVIEGKSWDGETFQLYLREDEAKGLLVQLGYYLYEESEAR